MFKKTLLEDLKEDDLKELVSPIIEVDAFQPKIDDKNIVVSFKVTDEDPAYDLSRFLEFSNNQVLDTEVSPGPDIDGSYIVFVEFNPHDLAKKIFKMLQAASYLTGIKTWTYKAYGQKGRLKVD